MIHARPEWYSKAACRGLSPDLFYGDRELGTESNVQNAIEVCRTCPVIMECLRYAYDNKEIYGVWGGIAPRRRRPGQIKQAIALVQSIIDSRDMLEMTPAARRRSISRKRSKLAAKSRVAP